MKISRGYLLCSSGRSSCVICKTNLQKGVKSKITTAKLRIQAARGLKWCRNKTASRLLSLEKIHLVNSWRDKRTQLTILHWMLESWEDTQIMRKPFYFLQNQLKFEFTQHNFKFYIKSPHTIRYFIYCRLRWFHEKISIFTKVKVRRIQTNMQ